MADAPIEPEPPLRRPTSCTDLFRVFTRMALQGFGGVLPVAQLELVEREHWLSHADFVEMLSVSQVLPGPNIVNLALMTGDRFFGLRGAAAAVGGMILAPMVVVLTLAALYGEFAHHPVVSGALRGMGAVAAGLVIATAVKLARGVKNNALGTPLSLGFGAITFVLIALLRIPLVTIVFTLGPVAVATAWWRLRR
jgi:chromate transporter